MREKLLLAVLFILAIAAAPATAQEKSAKSDNALAYLNLDVDNICRGWVIGLKAGYQWKIMADAGATLDSGLFTSSHRYSSDHTESGPAGTITLGYNFGEKFPITLGIAFATGPNAEMNTYSRFAYSEASTDYTAHSYQKVRIRTLDIGADYDFKNPSRWTPFVGVTGGFAFISHYGNTSVIGETSSPSSTTQWGGGYTTRHRTNVTIGSRAGVKLKIHDRITLSLYGSYSYLGKVPSYGYDATSSSPTIANPIHVKTNKITAHQLDLKVGVKICF